MVRMANVPRIGHVRAPLRDERHVSAAPSAEWTPAASAAYQDSGGVGEWVELSRRMTFTFAGIFVGAVSFRCMTLLRPLHQPPYPLTPSLFDVLPEGVRALHICSQAISAKLPRVSRFGRGICYVPVQGKRFFIELTGSFEAYLGKFSRKTRKKMRRRICLFTEASNGGVQWREYCDAMDIAEFHSLASEISRKTYQHRWLRASLSFREQIVRGG